MEKYISNNLSKKSDENKEIIPTHPPIYVLSCIKDPSLSNIKKYSQTNYCVQCHSGTIRNFVETHLVPFINQCWVEKTGDSIDNDHQQNEELLQGVKSYFK